MKKKEKNMIIFLGIAGIIFLCFSIASVFALDAARENRLAFGHVLYIQNVSMNPSQIPAGNPGTLKISLENTATDFIKDVQVELALPSEIAPYNDITKKKIAYMQSGESQDVTFSLIPLPNTDDGVYTANLMVDYINYIGDEWQENDTVSILVGSSPKLLAEFKSSDIYQGNNMGTINVKVVNNNVGNVKFLTVSLGESQDYKIIGSDTDYVGDLNSDDFSDAAFKIQVSGTKKVLELPVTLNYKDGLNKDYSQNVKVYFEIPTAKEAGITKSYTGWIVLLIVIIIIAYMVYRRYNKNLVKMKKAALSSLNISSKF